MTIKKINSRGPLLSDHFIANGIDLLDNFISKEVPNYIKTKYPKSNIKETDESYEIRMLVPGIKKEDISIELNNDLLTVSCEEKENSVDQEAHFLLREISFESFSRSFKLNKQVDSKKISARCVDGVLALSLAKSKDAVKKKIKID